jgi:2-oxoisovalerate dehydrogenase E2 component (dihydrolipoyl transacylase)
VAKVTMPQLGESVAEGTIGKWLKKPGDHVAKYEPLLEVITDKVNAEVPSPFAGVLTQILVAEGETVPNNAEIAVIDSVEDAAAGGVEAVSTTSAAAVGGAAGADAAVAASPGAALGSDVAVSRTPSSAPAPDSQGSPDARMTPAVRRLLREHGLTVEQVVGSGGGGRITRDDVTDYVEALRTGGAVGSQVARAAAATTALGASSVAPGVRSTPDYVPAPSLGLVGPTGPIGSPIVFPAGADEVLVPMTQMRKGIAAQMTRALAAPHAYVHMEVVATNLVRLRDAHKRDFQAREGISLSYVPFIVMACVDALRRHPAFNAHWTDGGLLAKRRVNVGVAVAVDDGLIVPVIRDVDQLSFAALNRAIADVAARARANKLRLDDFGGGTFTVDNTGWLGSNLTMPIINVPEVAIITMEAITKRAVVVETPDGDAIAIRPIMNMVLGIDHRANDGAGGAAFLRDVKAWLEGAGPEMALR